jgi:hypothetical protein
VRAVERTTTAGLSIAVVDTVVPLNAAVTGTDVDAVTDEVVTEEAALEEPQAPSMPEA